LGIPCADSGGLNTNYEALLSVHHATCFGDVFLDVTKVIFQAHAKLTRWAGKMTAGHDSMAWWVGLEVLSYFQCQSLSGPLAFALIRPALFGAERCCRVALIGIAQIKQSGASANSNVHRRYIVLKPNLIVRETLLWCNPVILPPLLGHQRLSGPG
jgi:hypothetical protein